MNTQQTLALRKGIRALEEKASAAEREIESLQRNRHDHHVANAVERRDECNEAARILRELLAEGTKVRP